ncbi:uncharacterized protein QC763_0034910 [Podospora pseudopauciseta]|uniref:Uncharacterized protein n=2 Tax=Podospora TaxID=5144 RepID=A0ABR0HNN1_9PEZI|nr:hypothetical protein QC763_0034910 [Podospora pseudopauciseta]KAK4679539.1 hypothetical protein QC764_0035800 [Podospora pseudoanserina]
MCHSEPPTVAQHPTPGKPLPTYLLDAFRCSAHLFFLTQQEAPGPTQDAAVRSQLSPTEPMSDGGRGSEATLAPHGPNGPRTDAGMPTGQDRQIGSDPESDSMHAIHQLLGAAAVAVEGARPSPASSGCSAPLIGTGSISTSSC